MYPHAFSQIFLGFSEIIHGFLYFKLVFISYHSKPYFLFKGQSKINTSNRIKSREQGEGFCLYFHTLDTITQNFLSAVDLAISRYASMQMANVIALQIVVYSLKNLLS